MLRGSVDLGNARDGAIFVTPGVANIPDRFRIGEGLVYDPERQHNKFRSSGLYVGDMWRTYELPGVLVTEDFPPLLDSCVSIFSVPQMLVVDLMNWTDDVLPLDGSPKTLTRHLRQGMANAVSAATLCGPGLSLEEDAIVLESNPTAGTSSGRTTNGLHFDDPDPLSLRIGVNLGSADRYIYYVPRAREDITHAAKCDERGNGYGPLAELDLQPMSIRIQPGEGWILPTTRFLHDGRRAADSGVSTFILATGRYSRA